MQMVVTQSLNSIFGESCLLHPLSANVALAIEMSHLSVVLQFADFTTMHQR